MMTRFPKAIVSFFQILPLRNAPHFQKALGHTKGNTDNFSISPHIFNERIRLDFPFGPHKDEHSPALFVYVGRLYGLTDLFVCFSTIRRRQGAYTAHYFLTQSLFLFFTSHGFPPFFIQYYIRNFFIFCCENNRKNSIVPLYCTHSK